MLQLNLRTLAKPKFGALQSQVTLNPDVYFYVNKDDIYAYYPNTNLAAKLSVEEYDFLRKHPYVQDPLLFEKYAGVINSFLYKRAAAPVQTANTQQHFVNASSIQHLSLIITTMCNLRCRYCYVYGGEPELLFQEKGLKNVSATLDTKKAMAVIDMFKPKALTISGWGEPFMAFDAMKEILAHVDTTKIAVEVSTGGVLGVRRKEIISYLIEHKIKLHISFDGPDRFQDANRPLPNGRSSVQEVLDTINELKTHGPLASFARARVTICGGMEDSIGEIASYLAGLGFKSIGFEPVELRGRAAEGIRLPDMNRFGANLANAIIEGKRQGFSIDSGLLPAASNSGLACFGCSLMAGEALTFAPDNSIYMCDDPLEVFKVGSVSAGPNGYGVQVDFDKISAISAKRHMFVLKECTNCAVKCGGGCAKESLLTYGNMETGGESKEYCDARRSTLFEYIKAAFRQLPSDEA